MWSSTESSIFVGSSAKSLNTSSWGYPWRVGLGNRGRNALPSSRKALSTDGFRLCPFDLRLTDGKGDALLNPFASVF